MATKEADWRVNGRYGEIGVEIIAGGESIAIVNRVQDARLRSLKQRPVKGDDPAREREIGRLQESWREAEWRAGLMAAAPMLLTHCREIAAVVEGRPVRNPFEVVDEIKALIATLEERRPPEGTPGAS